MLLGRLHPDEEEASFRAQIRGWTSLSQPYRAFLAWDGPRPIGLIDFRVRNYAEGAPDLAAPYVEDLWVEPDHRGRGIARALLAAVEQWARAQGYDWLGSDALIDNAASHAWHRAAGFAEVERLIVFGKPLEGVPKPRAPG